MQSSISIPIAPCHPSGIPASKSKLWGRNYIRLFFMVLAAPCWVWAAGEFDGNALANAEHPPLGGYPVIQVKDQAETQQNEAYKRFIKLQVSLATGTKNSLGIQSYADAHDYYCRLARDEQDAVAQFAMGWLYSTGKGGVLNHDIAARFFSLSAIQGHRDAREWLDQEPGNSDQATLPACMQKPDHRLANDAWVPADALFHKRGPIYQLVKKHAPAYGIEVDFAMAVIAVESGFNPKATSRKQAQGLMQLLPETQARFQVHDAYDPEQNIKGGLSYLRWLLAFFKGDVELVAAAYNAGENTVLKYHGVPPYPETRDYIQRIAHFYAKKKHAYAATK